MTLEIIGAGYGRTGTASLKMALEALGFGPCYHMSEVLSHAGHIDRWLGAAAGKPDWPAIFDGYHSTDKLGALNSGTLYFNVHSETNGGGEIRGQIVP